MRTPVRSRERVSVLSTQQALPPGRFRTVVADPPWPYHTEAPFRHAVSSTGNPQGVSARARYTVMRMSDILSLPVGLVCEKDAHLYVWTTNAFMCEAHEVVRAWGFEPKTIITWVKTKKCSFDPSMKTGYYYRGATEHVVFGVRGHLRLHGPPAPTAIFSERLAHSVKPDLFFEIVEQQSHPEYLELFARRCRSGWTVWGNEVHVREKVL